MYRGKVGAPPGGHWHFFLKDIIGLKDYTLSYDFEQNSYFLERTTKSIAKKDYFVIIRTSKYCYRVMYHNKITKEFCYESFRDSLSCAEMIFYYAEKYNLSANAEGVKNE